MIDQTITTIILDVVYVLVAGAISVATYYIKQKIDAGKAQEVLDAIKIAVNAAELIGAKYGYSGEQKLEFVIDKIQSVFPKLDEEKIRLLVEHTVAELKNAGQELTADEEGRIAPLAVPPTVVIPATVATDPSPEAIIK